VMLSSICSSRQQWPCEVLAPLRSRIPWCRGSYVKPHLNRSLTTYLNL
jgi:hypothetical protein